MTEKEQPSVSSTEELDHILVEQLLSTKRHLKVVKRHLKLMPNDPWLIKGATIIERKMEFFEGMISDKELIKKRKKKKKKECNPDILTRSPIYTMYRDTMIVTNIGYRFFMDMAQSYISLFTNKKKEK